MLGEPPWSLAGRRLPQFYLVSFRIDDPGKLSVLGIVNLIENVAAFFSQDFDQSVKVFYSVVDHERCGAGSKLVAFCRTDRPYGCSSNWVTLSVCPGERRAAPVLDIDSQVPLIPGLQRRSIFGLEENAANTS